MCNLRITLPFITFVCSIQKINTKGICEELKIFCKNRKIDRYVLYLCIDESIDIWID